VPRRAAVQRVAAQRVVDPNIDHLHISIST
jgi:hypothetical protein